MCGIAVIWGYHPSAPAVSRAELLLIRDHMRSRGPDGEGAYFSDNGRLALGHRRLSIIDLSAGGAQPMANEDGSLRVVFNGEIYNYRALREKLLREGVRFVSQSDTEVLLRLYERRGPAVVDELSGMYAFAIWDAQRQGLFVARDPLGIKPLYYADDGKTVRIASQVKALLAGEHISRTKDPAGVVGFHLWGAVPEPFTFYKAIRALPAGSRLWIDAAKGVGAPERFYNLPYRLQPNAPGASDGGLRASLLDTLRSHLIADVPVGLFLSAGLDSSTLAALASELAPENLHTVTLRFDELRGTPQDEAPLAEETAAYYGTRHRTVVVTRADFRRELPRLLEAMDQPTVDGVNTYFVSHAATQAGLKVALSGIGGDELFGGYPSFRQIPRLVHALRPLRSFPGIGRRIEHLSAKWIGRFMSPKYAGLMEFGASYEGAYLLRRALFMPWELPGLLDPELVREGWQALGTMEQLHALQEGSWEAHWRISALELSIYARNQLLRDADWAGMAHSLEIRVPFLDKNFIAEFYALRAADPTLTKRALATLPRKPLPEAIRRRPKTGFSAPVREWAAADLGGHLRERGLRGWARFIVQQM